MDVSCPLCQAQLILPAAVVGQSVCCPACRAVLWVEAGRLIENTPAGITAVPRQVQSFRLADDEAFRQLGHDSLDSILQE